MNKFKDILNFGDGVKTGNGFGNDLVANTNDRLERMIKAIEILDTTYEKIDQKNGKLQRTMLVLTVVTTLATVVQIWLVFKK
jgi:hypothetical protein